jgi:hypothetical protein
MLAGKRQQLIVPYSNTTLYVVHCVSEKPATLYADETIVTLLPNPIISNGRVSFVVGSPGCYEIFTDWAKQKKEAK